MKKIFLGLALVAGTFTFAQKTSSNTASSPVRFGLKAGLNVSSLSNSDTNSKAGFYGGVFANIPVAQDFSVQPEVLYSGMGAKAKANSDVKLNMDYIAVPVMLQYNALPNLYVEAGPQFSFLVSAKGKDNNGSVDVKDGFKTFDFGLGLGAGYYFTPNIGVNVRYVAGLTDVVKNRIGGDSSKNGVFQVGLAYKF
ncbi:PorT family protein [Chryseobacterium indologenes]|uniref:PorT family protein n=1 Tax=Chryseobacterium indologenes TaxID=253 RepID=A0A1Z3W022_CHRID|nr:MULTISPECIES: porin family protein [Chryseobacterium]ASE61122.1 PorT family protein [Chryseobacterium indologenes]ATN05205.1 PorT family protein [Chryseobacterium indologenes]AYY86040.1 PorT family protein [Chryseobacterium indologenes]AYZ35811.1 PorT family protein [Chryseobacterium indologenes]AZB16786.1 PorT family protein [Chryseobacterium indologenes]